MAQPSATTVKELVNKLGVKVYYGNLQLLAITNESGKTLTFVNPYEGSQGDVKDGDTNDRGAKGYIPVSNYGDNKGYEIHYYNDFLNNKVTVVIKDYGYAWLISLAQGETTLVSHLAAKEGSYISNFKVTVKSNGFELFDEDGSTKGGLYFSSA